MSDDILTLVIAPTNDCNMSCSYCYNRYNQNETKLEMILLDHLIRITFRSVRRVHFVWRGGEPLLVGSDYFESVFKLQEKYSKIYGTFYDNSIQTNGTLLNKRWLKILMKKKVSIGISFDGLINNKYRGNTDSIVEAFELCKKKKMPVGCIMVVNPSEHSLIEHYTYMKRYVNSIKFNPCFENNMEYPVPAEEYAEELNNLFDIWSKDKESIPVSPLMYYIEDVLGVYVTRECNNGKCLGKFIDVDSKGMIRICSHSSDSNYLLGHINDFDSIEELFNSDRFNSLVYAMIEKNKNCLQGCEFYNYCMGGCCVSRLNNSDYMCKVNKIVYPYIKKSVQLIIEQESLNEYNDTICHAIVKAFSVNPELFVL